MKVLSINASSRGKGNTAYACKILAEVVGGEDGEFVHYDLCKMDITPCKSCYVCETKGKCVVHDDWQKVYDAMWDADALVFGTPVYVLRESAWARIFIERSVYLISHTEGIGKKGNPYIRPCGSSGRSIRGRTTVCRRSACPAGKRVCLVVTKTTPSPSRPSRSWDI
ncbi:MAG: flavodoxin family protein [Actinomycetota bacterium]|nr:flavodoxin family protein [Actinomycetota bacterium]